MFFVVVFSDFVCFRSLYPRFYQRMRKILVPNNNLLSFFYNEHRVNFLNNLQNTQLKLFTTQVCLVFCFVLLFWVFLLFVLVSVFVLVCVCQFMGVFVSVGVHEWACASVRVCVYVSICGYPV